MRRKLGIIFGCLCILLGLLLAFSRHALHDIPFAAHSQAFRWEVELIVKAQAKGKPATLSVYNPSVRNAFQILDRSFSSKGFAISSARIDNRSTIDFYRKDPINGEQLFSIRYQMVRDLQKSVHPIASTSSHAFSRLEREKLEKIASKFNDGSPGHLKKLVIQMLSPDGAPSFLETRQLKLQALAMLGVPGKLYYGFSLPEARDVQSFSPYYLVVGEGEHFLYSFKDQKCLSRGDVFLWGSSKNPLYESSGLSEVKWGLSAIPVQMSLPKVKQRPTYWISHFLNWFSVQRLSVETQHSFGVLLLLPLAALIVAFLRNVIGFKTFGTFMPAILSLALRETGLFLGLFLLSLVLLLGVCLRILFKYFRLLLVPRLTATLTCVVMLLFLLSLIGMSIDEPSMTSLSLFPVVILSMIVERFSVALEEYGTIYGMRIMILSMVSAVISYTVITTPSMIYLFSAFPELNLCVLGGAILLGRYFGFRLFELFRFRELTPSGT